jgi:hypothetical protein
MFRAGIFLVDKLELQVSFFFHDKNTNQFRFSTNFCKKGAFKGLLRACKTFSQFCRQFGQSRSLLCNTLHLNATAPLHRTYSSEMWTAFLSNCGLTRSDCLATNLFLRSISSSGRKRKRETICIKPLCIYHWRKIAEFHPQCRHTIYRFRWIRLVFVRAINLWFGLHASKTFWRLTALLVEYLPV